MATKPTRLQQQACDQLAEALVLITEAARLDGKGKLDPDDLVVIAGRLAQTSSAFDLDAIVARALERRAKTLALPSSAAELLTLLETEIRPLEMLLRTDDEFKALVERMQEELGEV
jgi:fructose-1-phosphate kinase PfkB-like protein